MFFVGSDHTKSTGQRKNAYPRYRTDQERQQQLQKDKEIADHAAQSAKIKTSLRSKKNLIYLRNKKHYKSSSIMQHVYSKKVTNDLKQQSMLRIFVRLKQPEY